MQIHTQVHLPTAQKNKGTRNKKGNILRETKQQNARKEYL